MDDVGLRVSHGTQESAERGTKQAIERMALPAPVATAGGARCARPHRGLCVRSPEYTQERTCHVPQEKHDVLVKKLLGNRGADHVEVQPVHNALHQPLKRGPAQPGLSSPAQRITHLPGRLRQEHRKFQPSLENLSDLARSCLKKLKRLEM